MKSLTYPSLHRVDYAYNVAGHALQGIDSTGSPVVITSPVQRMHRMAM